MSFVLHPWQLLVVIMSAWMTKLQQELVDCVLTKNQVLKEKLGGKRILLNDDQRRQRAIKGKILGRKRLQQMGTLFTPDTILRWHRQLVAPKWDYSMRRKSSGRPRTSQVVVDLVVQMARENPSLQSVRLRATCCIHSSGDWSCNPRNGLAAISVPSRTTDST